MFGKDSIRLFRIRGIDVFLHWSWFLVAALEISSRQGAYSSPVWNIFEYLTLFIIVLLHEFGHALACRQVGGQANRIMLWPLGGVASINPPARPGAMLWSIAAGPLVNLMLVGVLWIASTAGNVLNLGQLTPDVHAFLYSLSLMNAGLLVFNLLPIYPLDGGQILRSVLWFVMGRAKSLMAAALFGFIGVAGVGLLAFGIGSPWLAVLGAYIGFNCWNGFRTARTLMRFEKASRNGNYCCPACQAHPQQGPFWKCHMCGAAFDTFDTHARCPECGTQFESAICLDCKVLNPLTAWTEAYPMNQPASTELESPGIKPLAAPLYDGKNWMRFAAVLTIAAGALTALTVIGIIVAWIPILAGIALYQAASGIEAAVTTGGGDNLIGAFSKLRTYFKLTAVMRVLLLGFLVLVAGFAITMTALLIHMQPRNEATVIANIEKINAAQSKYLMSSRAYGSFQDLARAGLIDPKLVEQNAGYRLQIETQKDNYIILASALSLGGRYDYYSFADAVVRYSGDSRKAPPGLSAAPLKQ
jgi:Zn-dependent protease